MDLRPYQRDLLEQIHTSIAREPTVLVLPTGAGKTVIFCALAQRYAERSQRVCILVHRAELIAQVSATLRTMGVAHRRARRMLRLPWPSKSPASCT